MEAVMLQKLFGSQARAEILKKLFTPEQKVVHLRELSRLCGLSAPVLQRELRQLVALGIVVAEKDGNRVNFSANSENQLYSLLCELVLKTEGPAGILKEAFADSAADFVFIFGSTAKGTAHAGSDIDLFVIGSCGLRDVTKHIHAVAERINQEVNPYVISRNDFRERIHKQDHFINEILTTPKIFLKGDADEFARLAE